MRQFQRIEIGADLLALAGVLAASALAWLVWMGAPAFPLDDAYIVQHAVEGLRSGSETRFIGAAPLDGATSPLHVFIIMIVSFVMPVAWAQAVVAAIAAALYLAGVYVLSRRAGLATPWSAAMTLLALIAGFTLAHIANGLETGLAMAGLVWSFLLFWRPRPHPAAWMLLAVLPFIRPELGLWSALLGLRAILAAPSKEDTRSRVGVVREAAIWGGATVLPLALIVTLLGGSLLPNTVGAKEAFFAEGCLPITERLGLVQQILTDGARYIALALAAPVLVLASRFRWPALAFIAVFLAVYTLKLPGAFFHNDYRYLHLLMPFALVGLIELLAPGSRAPGNTGRIIAIAALALSVVNLPEAVSRYGQRLDVSRIDLAGVSQWSATQLPLDAVIMVHDAGVISLHGQQRLVDIVGLKTRASAEAHQTTTFATCRRDPRALHQIASNAGATHLVVLREWDVRFDLTQGLRDSGWTLTRADGERGDTMYEVYALTPPG